MKQYLFLSIPILVFFAGCEKVIPVKLDKGISQLTVDAFLDDKPEMQVIRLTKTGDYFNNAPNPSVTGAQVKIIDNQGHSYNFIDNENSGNYSWTPTLNDTLVRLFNTYTLSVIYNGENFSATSMAFPTANINDVKYAPRKSITGTVTNNNAFAAYFNAFDIEGMVNFYWIKSYRNGVFYSKPGDMNLSQDGAFAGGGSDGLSFILPIREAVTPQNDSVLIGDSVTVKIYALNPETFFYLSEVVQQTTNGGLFATPPSNVSTNIKNLTAGSTTKAVGWFNIGQVSIGGVKIK